jgi:hypothetical protein
MADQEDAHFFETISVEAVHRMSSGDGAYTEAKKTWKVNAAMFQAMAREAQEQTDGLKPAVRCVVSTKSATEAAFTRREHFVPEGLGFDWTAPESGVGTCDEINARFSKYECEWLRQGQMGIFRPFFVGDGKDKPPAYYAPSMNDKRVWFTRERDGTRTLNIGPDVQVNLPARSGPGEILVRVPHNEARTEWVSLALHKMALLMFWLCEGPIAFDAAFTELRRFLIEPTEKTYRGYIENMVVGASPGVELNYFVEWRPAGGGEAEIETVRCAVRTHHMKYMLGLAGRQDPVPENLTANLSWKSWVDPKRKVPDHTAITFGTSGLEQGRASAPGAAVRRIG